MKIVTLQQNGPFALVQTATRTFEIWEYSFDGRECETVAMFNACSQKYAENKYSLFLDGKELDTDREDFILRLRIFSAALDNFDFQVMLIREQYKLFRHESIVEQVTERIDTIIDNNCDLFYSTMY